MQMTEEKKAVKSAIAALNGLKSSDDFILLVSSKRDKGNISVISIKDRYRFKLSIADIMIRYPSVKLLFEDVIEGLGR